MKPNEKTPFFRFCLQMMLRILATMCKRLMCCILYIFKYEMVMRAERRAPEEEDNQEGK